MVIDEDKEFSSEDENSNSKKSTNELISNKEGSKSQSPLANVNQDVNNND